MLLIMAAMNVCVTSCEKEDEVVDTTTRCTITNKISNTTLRDVNAIHVNSKGEKIKIEFIGDIPYGASKTLTCIGAAIYFSIEINGFVYYTAATDLKTGETTTVIIDDNTYIYW